ncbi:hypothetical protein ONE63_010247 [Megalurothrips usitatus]|uniref:Uncharacterized protein n=1 Tax=Megalurothrips usitatus TaxID=439358 RepID=A0AAV7XH88_9NEOP|nr:hypothetical protein ONE63_010247 [Megalurothrips usitatus]
MRAPGRVGAGGCGLGPLAVLALVVLAAGPGRPETATRGTDKSASAGTPAATHDNATVAAGHGRGLDSGSPFWDRLYWECGKRTSLRCVQKSAFRFLKKSLGEKDVVVTDSLVFRHNHNAVTPHPLADVPALLLAQNKQDAVDDTVTDEDLLQSGNALPTVEDITDDLYDQGMSFIKSHDVHLRLPSLLGGAEVRLSPRAFEEDGATFKISFSRPHVDPSDSDPAGGRMFMPNKKLGFLQKIGSESALTQLQSDEESLRPNKRPLCFHEKKSYRARVRRCTHTDARAPRSSAALHRAQPVGAQQRSSAARCGGRGSKSVLTGACAARRGAAGARPSVGGNAAAPRKKEKTMAVGAARRWVRLAGWRAGGLRGAPPCSAPPPHTGRLQL